MKRQELIKLLLIFSVIIVGCKSYGITLIERDRIIKLDTNEIYGDKLDYLEISGLIGLSSYNYKKIDVIIDNNNRKAILNFAGGGDGLLKLIELYGDNTKNIIFDYE